MTTFRIHASNGQSVDVQGEFKILDAGVLAVQPEHESVYLMSPAAWMQVNLLDPLVGLGEVVSGDL